MDVADRIHPFPLGERVLRQAAEADASANAHLFEPPDAIRGAAGAAFREGRYVRRSKSRIRST